MVFALVVGATLMRFLPTSDPPVNIAVVESHSLPIVVNSVGRLVPNHEVVLSSQVSGIVQAYRVDTGDAVTANKMLVLLDPTDYKLALNEARANLLSVKARYAAAKNSFLRAGELLPQKVITTEAYEKIEAEYLAWYECEFCSSKWDDEKRNRAVRNGHWRSRGDHQLLVKKYLETHNPKKIGFHLPAWIS